MRRRTFFLPVLGLAALLAAFRSPDGEPKPYPRSLAEVKAMVQVLAARKGPGATPENEYLSRLKQYRYLCGVPFENLSWGDREADLAAHASSICARLNKMTHTPEKPPGMSDAEYELSKSGAGHSNLYTGLTEPAACVDGWMEDSDDKNIDRVGHRRWCINPSMLKTGFAATGNYAAMYAHDSSNKEVPDWGFIAYPTAGYMPVAFFGNRHAWSVTPNPSKYETPAQDQVKVTIQPVDGRQAPAGAALKLDYYHVDAGGFGAGPAIIFRPSGFSPAHDAIFRVEISGLKPKGGAEGTIRYVVHFVNLQKVPDSPESASVCSRFFHERIAAIEGYSDKVDQLEAFAELLESEWALGTRSSIQKALAELLKDPALKREHSALMKWRQLSAMEQKAGKSKNQLTPVALGYREMAQAYKDTRAGRRAADGFERLKPLIQ
jgi:hypothetical protein